MLVNKIMFNRYVLFVVIGAIIFHGLFSRLAYSQNETKFDIALEQLLNKDYENAKKLLSIELQKQTVDIPENLSPLLTEPFFAINEINEQDIVALDDLDYIRKVVIYKKLVETITKGLRSDREIIFALFDWVYRNITVSCGIKERGLGRETTAFPYDYMMRGFGGCDRSAWVLVALANQAGFHANIVAMPSHSMTQIFFENKWVLFDCFYNVIFKNEENLLGLDDLPAIKTVIKESKCYYKEIYNDLNKYNIEVICEPLSILPKMAVLQTTLNRNCCNPPIIYFDIMDELSFAISSIVPEIAIKSDSYISVPYAFQSKKHKIYVALNPFIERYPYILGAYRKIIEEHYPYLKYFTNAGEFQIMGAYTSAIKEYDKVVAMPAQNSISSKLIYNKALCYYEMKDFSKASRLFKLYQKNYPNGEDANGVNYHLKLLNRSISVYVERTETEKEKDIINNNYKRIIRLLRFNIKDPYYKSVLHEGFFNLAAYYKKIDKLENALLAYRKAFDADSDLKDDPNLIKAIYGLGLSFQKRSLKKAEAVFSWYMELARASDSAY